MIGYIDLYMSIFRNKHIHENNFSFNLDIMPWEDIIAARYIYAYKVVESTADKLKYSFILSHNIILCISELGYSSIHCLPRFESTLYMSTLYTSTCNMSVCGL